MFHVQRQPVRKSRTLISFSNHYIWLFFTLSFSNQNDSNLDEGNLTWKNLWVFWRFLPFFLISLALIFSPLVNFHFFFQTRFVICLGKYLPLRKSYVVSAKLLPSTLIENNVFGLNPWKDPCIIVFGLIEFNGPVTQALSTTILIFKPFHQPNNWLLHSPNCQN